MKLIICIGEALEDVNRPDTIPLDGYWCAHRCPENDKHPWSQMRFIEDIVINKEGYDQVLITTHSPYIVDHLNNLMYAATLSPKQQKEAAKKFLRKNKAAFISQDRVEAWSFEKDQPMQDIMKRDTGRIDWRSFSRASNYVGGVWNDVDNIKHRPVAVKKERT